MHYHLKPITKENWRQAIGLKVAPNQESFIEPNTLSLLEPNDERDYQWVPLGLYVDQQMVGFAMIGAHDFEKQTIWLDCFMIDANYQGKGYERQFFKIVLNYLLEK